MKKVLILVIFILTMILSACGQQVISNSDKEDQYESQESVESSEVEKIHWLDDYESNKLILINYWTSNMDSDFEIAKESADFIDSNEELFPSATKEAITSLVDKNVTYKHINKSPDKYTATIFESTGYIVNIEEETVNNIGEVTQLHVIDDNMQSYEIMYLGELPDIFKEDVVYVSGLVLGASGFENVSGGFTNTIVLLGSYIEKVE